MNKYDKYINLAKKSGIEDALIISASDIAFDIRAYLKCGWGCDRQLFTSNKCDSRGTTYEERVQMVKRYNTILLLHGHDARQLSKTVLELERAAFLDGYYLACALRACNLCKECQSIKGKECVHPDKVRPCENLFGIDVYKTVRQLGLPCDVLTDKTATQNRYGFLLID